MPIEERDKDKIITQVEENDIKCEECTMTKDEGAVKHIETIWIKKVNYNPSTM
jgi:hypothetical protein